jgi:hypothetical protein
MAEDITIRQDIWQAVFSVLIDYDSEAQARMVASEIVDRFSRSRRANAGTYSVKPEVRAEIRKLLLARTMGQIAIAKELGVGVSTVQRIVDELANEGLVPPRNKKTPQS